MSVGVDSKAQSLRYSENISTRSVRLMRALRHRALSGLRERCREHALDSTAICLDLRFALTSEPHSSPSNKTAAIAQTHLLPRELHKAHSLHADLRASLSVVVGTAAANLSVECVNAHGESCQSAGVILGLSNPRRELSHPNRDMENVNGTIIRSPRRSPGRRRTIDPRKG